MLADKRAPFLLLHSPHYRDSPPPEWYVISIIGPTLTHYPSKSIMYASIHVSVAPCVGLDQGTETYIHQDSFRENYRSSVLCLFSPPPAPQSPSPIALVSPRASLCQTPYMIEILQQTACANYFLLLHNTYWYFLQLCS